MIIFTEDLPKTRSGKTMHRLLRDGRGPSAGRRHDARQRDGRRGDPRPGRRARGGRGTLTTASGCFSCEQNARTGALPPREEIHVGEHWRVAHAFGSALPGWLVIVPRRHVTALDELSDDEMEPLGPLLSRVTRALRAVTGCLKTYVILLAEAEGFAHVHFHVVPRLPGFTESERGPNVFTFLGRPESEWLAADETDRIAVRIRDELREFDPTQPHR